MPSIVPIHYEKADEFLGALRPTHAMWNQMVWPPRRDWSFRGQRDDTWPLLPAIWRDGARRNERNYWFHGAWELAKTQMDSVRGKRKHDHDPDWWRRVEVAACLLAEFEAVKEFTALANELGYATSTLPDKMTNDHWGWINHGNSILLPAPTAATALAQHHGIQTRLLDFTRRPLVAAFFAAKDAVEWVAEQRKNNPEEAPDMSKRLAVWAVRTTGLTEETANVKLFEYPRHTNPFLHAQDGIFLFHQDNDGMLMATGKRPCIGEIIADYMPQKHGPALDVLKITLPYSQAPALLHLLVAERVTLAHLMPTFDNVALTTNASPKPLPFTEQMGLAAALNSEPAKAPQVAFRQ